MAQRMEKWRYIIAKSYSVLECLVDCSKNIFATNTKSTTKITKVIVNKPTKGMK